MASSNEVRAGLSEYLARLWRYGLILSNSRDVAENLVQATCLRALERANQYQRSTRFDRWLFALLRSIWLNEVGADRIREGSGFAKPEKALFSNGEELDAGIYVGQVLNAVLDLPVAQREAVLLVYVEGMSYKEASDFLAAPVGTIVCRLAAARSALGGLKAKSAAR